MDMDIDMDIDLTFEDDLMQADEVRSALSLLFSLCHCPPAYLHAAPGPAKRLCIVC
jgi:hypothetical protein